MRSEDPTVIRSLAVTASDIVAALEANQRREAGAVLRVTPPFSGRMRARLHMEGTEGDYDEPEPLHVPPERLVESVPPFPTPDDTEDKIRSDPESRYTREIHRRHHEQAIEAWRESVHEQFRQRVMLDTCAGEHEVSLAVLGNTG